jgi:hypothetical protein
VNPDPNFEQIMIVHLNALAVILLEQKMYRRLSTVASLLSGLSSGGWRRFSDDERESFLNQMANDFHVRAWDDWEDRDKCLFNIRELIYAVQRGLRTKA